MTCVVINNALILIFMHSMLNLGDTEVVTYIILVLLKRAGHEALATTSIKKSPQTMGNGLAELLTIPENMNSQPLFSGVCVALSLVFCAMFCRSLFVLFHLSIVLYVFLRITASDNPFVIFNFSYINTSHICHADDENLAQSLIGHDCSVNTEYQDTKLK